MDTGRVKSGGRGPTRTYVCPDCGIAFMAWSEKNGKRCPNGHWRSMYHLNYYAEHGRLPDPYIRVRAPARRPVGPPKPPALALAELGFERRTEQCELALQLWLTGFDRLMAQLPASTSRLLVAGAFERTADISRQLVVTS